MKTIILFIFKRKQYTLPYSI